LEKVAQNAREDEKILSGELKKKIFTVPCVGKCIFCIFVRVFLMRSKNEKEKQKSFFSNQFSPPQSSFLTFFL